MQREGKYLTRQQKQEDETESDHDKCMKVRVSANYTVELSYLGDRRLATDLNRI